MPIVTITLECLKTNEEGELEMQTIITRWRVFGLQQILEKNSSGSIKNLVYIANHEENGNIMLLRVNSEREVSAVKMISPFCEIHICGCRDEEQIGLDACQYITIAWHNIYF